MGDRILKSLAWVAAMAGIAGAEPAGRVTGKVTITDANGKRAVAEAIVYVVGYAEPAAPTMKPVAIEQKNRKFVPDLVAITLGDSVEFPNRDTFLHNVFSQSTTRKFDLGSFRRGDTKSKDFPNTGVVDLYCNIHPEMAATILVLPNRRHTRAAADGSFTIDGIKPGTWTVFAYTRRMTKPASARVTITTDQATTANFTLVRGAEPEHLNKYGERYHDSGTTTYR